MDDASDRQKLALLDGGWWILKPAEVLKGEIVRTVCMSSDKKNAIRGFCAGIPSGIERNYQITEIPDYFNDGAAMERLIKTHIYDKNLVAPFMDSLPEEYFETTLEERGRALINFLKL